MTSKQATNGAPCSACLYFGWYAISILAGARRSGVRRRSMARWDRGGARHSGGSLARAAPNSREASPELTALMQRRAHREEGRARALEPGGVPDVHLRARAQERESPDLHKNRVGGKPRAVFGGNGTGEVTHLARAHAGAGCSESSPCRSSSESHSYPSSSGAAT